MALKIKFSDKKHTEVEYLTAIETEEYWGGSNRRTLSFELARNATNLDTLDTLCTEANCGSLQLINTDEDITNIYEGYVLKLKVAVEPVLTDPEQQTYEERIKLKLGKRTYIEQRLHELGIG